MQTILGIDIGTQSVKVLCYDYRERAVAAVASAPLALDHDAQGKAEQHPLAWADALADALAKIPDDIRRSIRAIGVSGQQHGLVALDSRGEPIRAAKLWCDTTTQAEVDEITTACGGTDAMIGLAGNAMVTGFTAPKIRWLKKHEPDNYAQLAHILLPHDYINYLLTSELAMEHGDASGTGLLDVRERTWSRPLLDAVDGERDLAECLPPLVAAGEPIGETTAASAKRFGLPAGIPVAVGGGDNMMGAIGTGNVARGVLTMSLGTSGTLYAHSDKPVIDPKGNIAAFCSSTGGWLPLLCTMNCTYATELIRGPLGIELSEFDAMLGTVAPGADGLITVPFFNGERTPNLPQARASIVGLSAANCTKAHWLRATVEGVTFALKFGIDELAALGLTGSEIVLTGGGANSRAWRQIVADVTGLPVTLLKNNEGACFGAALQALWTLERQTDPAATIEAITDRHVERDPSQSVEPKAEHVAVYAETYRDYQRAVEQTTPLYRA